MARILIADDNTGQRDVLVEMLQGLGHQCVGAEDGLKAKAALEKEDYDLLVTDLRMPGLDGLGLLEAVRKMDRKTVLCLRLSTSGYRSATRSWMVSTSATPRARGGGTP